MNAAGASDVADAFDRVGRGRDDARDCRRRQAAANQAALDRLLRDTAWRRAHRSALPDSSVRRRSAAAHDGRVLLLRSRPSRPTASGSLRAYRRRDPHHEHRRNGHPSPHDERPGQLPRLVARRQADRLHPARSKTEWTLHTMSSSGAGQRPLTKAPPSGRPSWTAGGLLIPSGGDLLKIDPATGHVLKYYGAQIDAIWGLNSRRALARSLDDHVRRRAEPPSRETRSAAKAPASGSRSTRRSIVGKKQSKKPQRVVKDAGPATFSPNGTQLALRRERRAHSGRSPAASRLHIDRAMPIPRCRLRPPGSRNRGVGRLPR